MIWNLLTITPYTSVELSMQHTTMELGKQQKQFMLVCKYDTITTSSIAQYITQCTGVQCTIILHNETRIHVRTINIYVHLYIRFALFCFVNIATTRYRLCVVASTETLRCYECTSYMYQCKTTVDNRQHDIYNTTCRTKCFVRVGEDHGACTDLSVV